MSFKQIDLENFIKEKGLKITPHRILILSLISKSKTPIAAFKLIEDLKKKIKIDQATIYRNLQILEKHQVIRRYDYNHGHSHYELFDNKIKNQLICINCETIENISDTGIDFKKILKKSKKFKQIDNNSVHIYGLCKLCA